MHNTNTNHMPAHTCSILQIQIIQMFDVGVCVHIHAQMYRRILPCTTHSFLYTHISTHTHPIHPMCVHIGVYPSTHALIRSLSHTHIHRPSVSHPAPPHTLSATCAASGCASSSAATTSSPAPYSTAKCRGSLPLCARADSRQCQHTTHPASQQHSHKTVCSCLLLLCEAAMRPLLLVMCAVCVRVPMASARARERV